MSAEAEAKSGVLGEAARVAYLERAGIGGGLQCWPMTAPQMAFAKSIDGLPGWVIVARNIAAIAECGRLRFSAHEAITGLISAGEVKQLIALGILRRHDYDSGAWQAELTPYTRSWYLFLLTDPKAAP